MKTSQPMLLLRSLLLAVAIGGAAAQAHTTSTAYLQIDAQAGTAAYRVALRDLDALLDLDADGDGRLTWGEVEDRSADIRRLAGRALVFSRGDSACALSVAAPRFVRSGDVGAVVLDIGSRCAAAGALQLDYRLFEDIDPSHRVLVAIDGEAAPRLQAPGSRIALQQAPAQRAAAFFAQGAAHIAGGIDHLLFLIALLLPAVLLRENGRWRAHPRPRAAMVSVAWIVTAFTVAHSITLALASFGLLRIPASIIEPLIAATVLAAALNNLYPLVTRRLAWVAFAFGLVHGFGFAEVLAPLGLPPLELARALALFNLGVEVGQLAIVAAAFALLAALRGRPFYPRWVLQGGSAALALIACGWIVERVFDLRMFPA